VLPAGVDPRAAAVGLHALVDGLITNWLIDPKYFPLAREAEGMVDRYLEGLGARAQPAARQGAKRRGDGEERGTSRAPAPARRAARPSTSRAEARKRDRTIQLHDLRPPRLPSPLPAPRKRPPARRTRTAAAR
jgi:TetR/AcrR family acrAB operon transcriptional repressor